MSQPTSVTKPIYTHTIWRQKPLGTVQRLVSTVITVPENKLQRLVKKYKICFAHRWDDKLRLTISLGNKSSEEALSDLGALLEDEGLDKYWEFVTQVLTDDPCKIDARIQDIN
ncbi:hypothetical protein FGADI_7536 [Fusarium gaditjirri]|uniref:Uncharacterized protein n=1 Tax=Fusarium gaditjirri TaxID=282569 RepID=A0A8H4T4Z6_9HYPO|nr:hypothetical protein FGADI_7536 [Fusarium gaditjirri]